MDRTELCGSSDVGSIPTEGTLDFKSTPTCRGAFKISR